MSYQHVITKATGRTDPEEIRRITDCMRSDVFKSTLDWQSQAQLEEGARIAVEVLISLGDLEEASQ